MTNSHNGLRYVADGRGSVNLVPATFSPAPGEVVLRTLYAGVNRGDVLGLAGAYGEPFPEGKPLGQDAVGVVESVGSPDLDHLRGETVFGHVTGAWATHVVADATSLAPTGELSPEVAVTLPLAGFTALRLARAADHALDGLSGRKALITGGTGAAGGLLTDLLHSMGAEVWLLSRHEHQSSAHVVHSLSDAPMFDLAFESIGGTLMDQALQQLAPGGHLWWFGEVTRQPVTLNFFDYLGTPWTLHHFSNWVHDSTDANDLRHLLALAQAHVITPPAATSIDATRLPAALTSIAQGDIKDKVLIRFGLPDVTSRLGSVGRRD